MERPWQAVSLWSNEQDELEQLSLKLCPWEESNRLFLVFQGHICLSLSAVSFLLGCSSVVEGWKMASLCRQTFYRAATEMCSVRC